MVCKTCADTTAFQNVSRLSGLGIHKSIIIVIVLLVRCIGFFESNNVLFQGHWWLFCLVFNRFIRVRLKSVSGDCDKAKASAT